MLLKEHVNETLKTLPNEFSIDLLFEKLSFIESVETGLLDSKNDQIISDEELDKEIEIW